MVNITKRNELNKIIQYITAAIAICTVTVLYGYAAFYYRFAFNFETEINGQYFFAFVAVAGFALIAALNIFRKDNNKIQYGGMIIVTLLLLFSLFSDRYSFANEYYTVVLSSFLLFVCLLFLPARVIAVFPYFLIVMLLWQLGLAFQQMEGLLFHAGQLNLQGSLQNSGVFCCYLVIHLPLLYYFVLQRSGKLTRWLKVIFFITIVVFIGFIIYRSQSRSAIIGVVAAILSQCLFTCGRIVKAWLQRLPKWAISTGIGFLIVVVSSAAWYLFFLKKASAFGRVMKWEIAGQHIGDHFFTGTGIGRFSWYYPQWQAQYFVNNPHAPEAYFLSAGESYIIFNEYFQLFETIGLIGFAGFALLLVWFFRTRSVEHAGLLSAIKATLVVLLATAFTTYSFHVNVLLVLLAICFAATAIISIKPSPMRRGVIIPVLLFGVAACTTLVCYQKWSAAESWRTAREASIKTLGTDGKFLTEYGQWQLENGQAEAAVKTLEKAKQYFISRSTMDALATAYEQAGNYAAAIETRQWLCGYLPNRFAPKYDLLKLYKKAGDTTGVHKMVITILTMPVKIPSTEVDKIIEEVKKMEQ